MPENIDGSVINRVEIAEGFEQARNGVSEVYLDSYLGQNLGGIHMSARTAEMSPLKMALDLGDDVRAAAIAKAHYDTSTNPQYVVGRYMAERPDDQEVVDLFVETASATYNNFIPRRPELADSLALASAGHDDLAVGMFDGLNWRIRTDRDDWTRSNDAQREVLAHAEIFAAIDDPEDSHGLSERLDDKLDANWDLMTPDDQAETCQKIAELTDSREVIERMTTIPNFTMYHDSPEMSPRVQAARLAVQLRPDDAELIELTIEAAKVDIPEHQEHELALVEAVAYRASSVDLMAIVETAPEEQRKMLIRQLEELGAIEAAYLLGKTDKSLTDRLATVQRGVTSFGLDAIEPEVQALIEKVDPLDQAVILGGAAISGYAQGESNTSIRLVSNIDIRPMRDAAVASIVHGNAQNQGFATELEPLTQATSAETAIGRRLRGFADSFSSPDDIVQGATQAREKNGFVGAGNYYQANILGSGIPGLEEVLKTSDKQLS